MFPTENLVRNISASLDVGWYLRIPFANPEPGSIVMFPIPESVIHLAEQNNMPLNIPLMKRVESITPDGELVVKGDCGGARSLDSRYYGAISRSEITGVYAPIPWTMTPCKTLVDDEGEEGREA